MNKTKRALLAALACSAALAGAFGLAACNNGGNGGEGGGGEGTQHNHNYVNWQSVNATTHKGTCNSTTGTCDAPEKTEGHDNNGTGGICSKCGYDPSAGGETTTHSHVWGEWVVSESAKQGYVGTATRECTGEGTCDADESLTTVTIPSALYGDYDYPEPVVKTEATCTTQGVYTYKYTDPDNAEIVVSFDVNKGYGDHSVVGNECELCHLSAVAAVLNDEVTVNATSEKATILVFTAEKAGKYRFNYTEGKGANINNNTVDFPSAIELKAGEKAFFEIKAPEETASATYKIEVVPVTVLKAEVDEEDNLVGSATINVGGGKTAMLEVVGKPGFNGTITYGGTESLTFTWYVYSNETQQMVPYSFTLSENEPTHVLGFSVGAVSELYTVTSDAETAFDAQLSFKLEEKEEDLQISLGEYSEKEFKDIDYGGKTYYFEIGEGGTYTVDVRGVDVEDGKVYYEVRSDADDEESVIDANDDGSYTFASDTTYYLVIAANDTEYTVSGIVSITEYVALPTAELNVAVSGENGDVYAIDLEAGDYQIMVDGEAVSIDISNWDNIIWVKDNGDNYLTDNNKVITIEVAGTYYIELYDDVTFKVVAKSEGGEEEPKEPVNIAFTSDKAPAEMAAVGTLYEDYLTWEGKGNWNAGGEGTNAIQVGVGTKITLKVAGKVTVSWFSGQGTDADILVYYSAEGKATIEVVCASGKYMTGLTVDPNDVPAASKVINVTLNYDNGSENGSWKAVVGAVMNKPADPTKEGAKFLGWKLGENDYDFTEAVPDSDTLELVAQWGEEDPDYDLTAGGSVNLYEFKTGEVQNTTATYRGIIVDATSGKFDATRTNDVQINSGTKLKFKVNAGTTAAQISAEFTAPAGSQYMPTVDYSIETIEGETYAVIEFTNNCYPGVMTITITPASTEEGGEEA